MKKIFILIILIFTITLTGCGGNRVVPNEGKIVFEFPEEYRKYLPYEEIPYHVLEFEGVINTTVSGSLSNKKFFAKNDDFILSDILAKEFEYYKEKDRLTIRLLKREEQFETRMNRLVTDSEGNKKHESQVMRVEDGAVFNEIAYINLENGLTLSFEYRRFVSTFEGEAKTYYAWRYNSPLNAVLHYPVMLHKNDQGETILLIVPTPTKVIYHLGVSTQLPLNKLINNEKYFEENFRRFFYPDYTGDPSSTEVFDREDNIRQVVEYYKRDFNGKMEGENLLFSYLGYDFKVTFEEESFLIDII